MDYLRALFEGLGFSNVETLIASGNVIFDSKSKNTRAIEQKIEKHLQAALGYEVATFVRAVSELGAVARYKPFGDSELDIESPATLYIGFLAELPGEQAKQKLLSFATEIDDFHVSGREVYWLFRRKFSESGFSGALLEKTLGMKTTLRNSNTIKRIVTKYPR